MLHIHIIALFSLLLVAVTFGFCLSAMLGAAQEADRKIEEEKAREK